LYDLALASYLRDAKAKEKHDDTMRIAFMNEKGGVGKTTSTANVGWLLSEVHHLPTVLVDLSPQATLSHVLQYEDPAATVCDWLLEDAPGADAFTRVTDTLSLIRGGRDLVERGADRKLAANAFLLGDRIKGSPAAEGYWLIDTPPEIGACTVAALAAADHVVVVTQAFRESVTGLMQLMKTIEQIRRVRNDQGPRLAGILPTFVQSRPRLHRQVIAELDEQFPNMVLPSIPHTVAVQYAASERLPVVANEPKHRAAIAYGEATAELLKRIGS